MRGMRQHTYKACAGFAAANIMFALHGREADTEASFVVTATRGWEEDSRAEDGLAWGSRERETGCGRAGERRERDTGKKTGWRGSAGGGTQVVGEQGEGPREWESRERDTGRVLLPLTPRHACI